MRLPQRATLVFLKRGSHLSLCVILDRFAGLELLIAAFAMTECDWCEFDYLENSLDHAIQLYRSNIPWPCGSILVSPIASLLWLIAAFRVSV